MCAKVSNLILNDGNRLPSVGLGTFQGNYDYTSVYNAVLTSVRNAIDLGYRHFDTAWLYDTEEPLGAAIREKIDEGVLKREDVFITTKLWCTSHKCHLVVPALKQSLAVLQMTYVDVYLVHWPIAMRPGDEKIPKDSDGNTLFDDENTSLMETWQGMEECKQLGLAKSIGVSNFTPRQLKILLDNCSIKPAICQMECHPFFTNDRWVKFCQDNGIAVCCYSPVGKPSRPWLKPEDPSVFTDPLLNEIASKHRKTPAQVALRFQIQRGLGVIPKSNDPGRQKENLNIFDFALTSEEMDRIHKGNRNFRILWLDYLRPSKEYPFADDA